MRERDRADKLMPNCSRRPPTGSGGSKASWWCSRIDRGGARSPAENAQTRRFPPPWSVEEMDACFIVCDYGQVLACVYRQEVL